jgi:hypothetical protein
MCEEMPSSLNNVIAAASTTATKSPTKMLMNLFLKFLLKLLMKLLWHMSDAKQYLEEAERLVVAVEEKSERVDFVDPADLKHPDHILFHNSQCT